MAKVDWLTTAVLLILSSIGLVNGQFEAFSSKLEAWACSLEQKLARNAEQIQADNVINRGGVRINRKKRYKKKVQSWDILKIYQPASTLIKA
jgi:hypothetical protein